MTDLFEPTTPPNLGAPKPRACTHPRSARQLFDSGVACGRCGKEIPPEASRRGRTNRARGNAIERAVGKQLGLERIGQFGGPTDLTHELFAAQVKSGTSFPERLYSWLRQVPVKAGQTPILVITDAPGPGHRRRALVVLDLDEWIALHGQNGVAR